MIAESVILYARISHVENTQNATITTIIVSAHFFTYKLEVIIVELSRQYQLLEVVSLILREE